MQTQPTWTVENQDLSRRRDTSLVTNRFSVGSKVDTSAPQAWLFDKHEDERRLMLRVMTEVEPKPNRLKRFRICGKFAMVQTNVQSGAYRVRANFCEQRSCPHCQKRLAWEMGIRVGSWIRQFKRRDLRFITLTVAHTQEPLRMQLKKLRASFRRLRDTDFWKDSQDEGRAVIEVKWNDKSKRWHPHIHIISKGKFMPQKVLSLKWKKASKGSAIVDIREVKNIQKASDYLGKYVGKIPSLPTGEEGYELRKEYYSAVRGAKMVFSLGDAGPLPELEKIHDPDSNPKNWKTFARLADVIDQAEKGCPESKKILAAIRNGGLPPPT